MILLLLRWLISRRPPAANRTRLRTRLANVPWIHWLLAEEPIGPNVTFNQHLTSMVSWLIRFALVLIPVLRYRHHGQYHGQC